MFLAASIGAHMIPTQALGVSHWLSAVPAGGVLAVYPLVVWLKYEPKLPRDP